MRMENAEKRRLRNLSMLKPPLLFRPILVCGPILIAAAAGCGPGQGDLSGKVTFEGRPLAMGSIVVAGSDGIVKSGPIKDDGTYEVKDIAAGDIKITVSSIDPASKKIVPRKLDAEPPPPKADPRWFEIPEAYGDFNRSELTFQLNSGRNFFNIDLKEKND
jgi:hypothetical protein